MDKLYSPATIKRIKEQFGFRFSKSLGQNFLIDYNIISKIVDKSLIDAEDLVIEIGPGIGVLTNELAKAAKKVVAIELDRNLFPILKETLAEHDNVTLLHGDILKIDLNSVIAEHGTDTKGVKILGNLPYYITTPIIMKVLEEGVQADSLTIMLQKEVGDRLQAQPKSKEYGSLSVAVQYYCDVVQIAKVPKESFMPAPKVDSVVMRLDIRKEKPVDVSDEALFFQAIKSGFGQRRKTLLNSLSSGLSLAKDQTQQILEQAGIDPVRRAETLDIKEFAVLANSISAYLSQK